jgi:predicted Zn-dependent protease
MKLLTIAAVVLLSFATLTGCATTGAHGEQSLILIDTPTEVRMGVESDMGIRQEYPVLENAELAAYISDIGAAVAVHSDRKDVEYSFTVLDSDIVNAFAAPGGFISRPDCWPWPTMRLKSPVC